MTKEIKVSRCCGEETLVVDENVMQDATEDIIEEIKENVSDEIAHDSHSDGPTGDHLKDIVRKRYARAAKENDGCGCGCSDDKRDSEYSFVGEEYAGREGYAPEADLGLGCGVPTDIAGIKEGDTVLDLGSGAGIDAFIAREQVGEEGEVIGVDFTSEMIQKATENAEKLGYSNVRFLEGDIENLPVLQRSIDVVISNCVLNLVPDKQKAFAEMFRVLRQGAHFMVSDIVILGELPDRLRDSATLYAGCVSGAIAQEDYLELLRSAGFSNVQVARERVIDIPDSILHQVASREEVDAFKGSGGIASITVTGVRSE